MSDRTSLGDFVLQYYLLPEIGGESLYNIIRDWHYGYDNDATINGVVFAKPYTFELAK